MNTEINSTLKEFLLEKSHFYNNLEFIENDPIQIPHRFSKREDIEISALLTSTISWGNRLSIIKSANSMMNILENDPLHFVLNHTKKDLQNIPNAIHRTFNREDFIFFISSLKNIYQKYQKYQNLESAFLINQENELNLKPNLLNFRKIFFELPHQNRTEKHIGNPDKNSACKRINMFLRWMVRKDSKSVDFGIWNNLDISLLSCPLDVHSGNIARKYGLLTRTQNDWKAVEELNASLKEINPIDPTLLDFALFGLGIDEK